MSKFVSFFLYFILIFCFSGIVIMVAECTRDDFEEQIREKDADIAEAIKARDAFRETLKQFDSEVDFYEYQKRQELSYLFQDLKPFVNKSIYYKVFSDFENHDLTDKSLINVTLEKSGEVMVLELSGDEWKVRGDSLFQTFDYIGKINNISIHYETN